MYLPKLFANDDRPQLVALMRAHPFATVIALHDRAPEISHLPLLVLDDGERLRIQGHAALGNPLAKMVADGVDVTCVFHGPHAYVSPRLYVNADNVPTWSYATVHARGHARALPPDASLPHLQALIDTFEAGAGEPWRMSAAGDLPAQIVRGLVAFELEVEKLEGKFKLSQNRKPEDRAAVMAAFERSRDPAERAVLELMKQNPPR